jgi:proteasome alpha subunit
MYDEPHRWLQAVENRILYVEKRLRGASPVVGLPYEDGAVLFTVCPHGQQKLYEVYDRLALGGLGHPADVERLRMMAINLAHTEGFTRSAADVTLQRLLNFAIAPQVKTAFDEVFRSPVIAKFLMVELDHVTDDTRFFTLNFDGNFSSRDTFGIAAGTHQAEELMARRLEEHPPSSASLSDVLESALMVWAVGHAVDTNGTQYDDPPMPSEEDLGDKLREATDKLEFEAAVLDRSGVSKAKYRALTSDEIAPLNELIDGLPGGDDA